LIASGIDYFTLPDHFRRSDGIDPKLSVTQGNKGQTKARQLLDAGLMTAKRVLFLGWWRFSGIFIPSHWLFLAYDDLTLTDGGGNQALRITGIKAVCTLFGIGYSHKPISRIDNHGVSALLGDRVEPARLTAWNKLVAFESAQHIPASAEIVPVDTLRLSHLFHWRHLSATLRQPFILSIANPFPVSDFFPNAYAHINSDHRPSHSRSCSPLRIALHVRRGDLMWTHSERLLPVQYYLNVALRIVNILESLNIEYTCELYSEELTSSLILQPGDHGISPDSKTPVVLNPESNDLQLLEPIPHLVKYINYDPVDSIKRMATADILITSKSAFSYLAAINNYDGIIVYHHFWHPPLQNWIWCDQEVLFSEKHFRRRLSKRLPSTH
jgi:hypothetical protein